MRFGGLNLQAPAGDALSPTNVGEDKIKSLQLQGRSAVWSRISSTNQQILFFGGRGGDDELDREPGFLGLQLVEALKFNWLLPRFQIRG
jgi:hypothetical protein